MSTETEKRTVEEIVEAEWGEPLSTAMAVHELQNLATCLVEQYSDTNKPGYPIMWDVVDYMGMPREFVELCQKVAEYEVRL